IPPIDADEDRGQCLGGGGIGERPAVDTPRARRIRQFDHHRAGLFVVPEHEHVTIDRPAGFELGCAAIVELGLDAAGAGGQPLGGSCTTETLGGTRGTTASTTILPVTAGLISFRMASWFAYGTAITTMSAFAAAVRLSSPLTAEP